jgi:signal transduction histidine kinase
MVHDGERTTIAEPRAARRILPAVGFGYWASAALAVALVAVCTVNSLRWIDRPFPGFLLWDNLLVPAVSDTDWTGHEAGVPWLSRLATVNGRPVTSAEEVYRIAERLPLGTEVEYGFVRPHDEQAIAMRVPTMRMLISDYFWIFGNYLLTGSLLVFLGFLVYLLRPDSKAARAMFVFATIWGLFLVTSADIFGPGWFRPLCRVLEALGPIAGVHLALAFPVERKVLARRPYLLPALYAFGLTIGVADNLLFHQWFAAVHAIVLFNSGGVTLGGIVLLGSLLEAYVRPPSPAVRQRTKIAIIGAVVAFLAPVVGYLSRVVLGVNFPLNFTALSVALFPAAIGFSIVKYDLFEVDAIIRRAVAWAILTALVGATYLGGIGAIDALFAGRSRAAELVFFLVVVALLNPLRERIQAAVDYVFARDRYDYRRTVTEASQELTSLLELEKVVRRLLDTVTNTIHIDFGAVWLGRDGDGYALHALAGTRANAAVPERLGRDSPIVHRLEVAPQTLLLGEDENARDQLAQGELDGIGVTLLVPMSFERRLIGFLGLGDKESGYFYSADDLELLRTLANQAAVAVENARSYRALAHANEELRSAQSRLVVAERFAAIGEVSAAVAHGIRNPLAGIKVAAQLATIGLPAEHPLRENFGDIIAEANKLEARVRGLLDFAKPFEPHLQPTRMADVVADAVGGLRSQIAAHAVEVVSEIDPDMPLVSIDHVQIGEVLLVLLSNAIEAMPNGGRIDVRVALCAGGERVRIDVADDGPGISPDQQQHLFELFFTTKASGTGLGLPVAKKIAERHGGTITVHSEVGAGSRFSVELPISPHES